MSKITEVRIGKICAKHPELQGNRLASNGNCIQCARDAAAKQHAARTMTVGQEITTLRGQLHKLQMENEALRKDAERFRYILQDADSGMRRIYGDDWIATIDAQGFQL